MTSASTYSDKAERPSADTPIIHTHPTPEEVLNLPKRPSSLADEQCILHGEKPAAGQVLILNSQNALAQVNKHSQSNLRSELGGVLLGHAYREGEMLVVDVKAALPATSDDHGPVHFTFTADAWSQIHRDRAVQFPAMDIVGWFHTHPGLSVFYSSDDVVVHSAAFTLPWHLGLVVDPIRNESAYFGWVNGEIAPIGGYYERTDVQSRPIVGWTAVKTSVYNVSEADLVESSARGESESLDSTVYMPDNQWLSLSPSSQKLGLIVGTLALAFALFLFVFWVVPANKRAKEMETVILTMANVPINPNALACPNPNLRILSPIDGSRTQVGTKFDVLGTTQFPDASRYVVETRLVGQEAWQPPLGTPRQDRNLGTLATWNTTDFEPGDYELRLTAVDRNNIRLNQVNCSINIELK